MKFVITVADNGFIVKFINCGMSMLHEPYIKPLTVYGSFADLMLALEKVIKGAKK